MGMSRMERIALHKKQERMQVKVGIPLVADLQESVPELRRTNEGVVQYTKYKNVLYKTILTRA